MDSDLLDLLRQLPLLQALGATWTVVYKVLLPILFLPLLASALLAARAWRERAVILHFYLFAVSSFVGATLGVSAGLSRNSVVHVVLTVSMTFVVTVLGYVGTREAAKRVQAAIPGAILIFVLSLLIALLYGTFLRESWYQA